jgi:hypothetical protein
VVARRGREALIGLLEGKVAVVSTDLQVIPDGETRPRTGDTTISDNRAPIPSRPETPAINRVYGFTGRRDNEQ